MLNGWGDAEYARRNRGVDRGSRVGVVRHCVGVLNVETVLVYSHRSPSREPTLSPEQLRFLRLHQDHFVERTQKLFEGAMIRATSTGGKTATIRLDELESLVGAGLMRPDWGGAFKVTVEGAQL